MEDEAHEGDHSVTAVARAADKCAVDTRTQQGGSDGRLHVVERERLADGTLSACPRMLTNRWIRRKFTMIVNSREMTAA
ncbi:hypothetical protein [Microbacterium aurum]